jgi:hypothetical protein
MFPCAQLSITPWRYMVQLRTRWRWVIASLPSSFTARRGRSARCPFEKTFWRREMSFSSTSFEPEFLGPSPDRRTYACCKFHPPYISWFDDLSNTWRVHAMKLLITRFSPLFFTLIMNIRLIVVYSVLQVSYTKVRIISRVTILILYIPRAYWF